LTRGPLVNLKRARLTSKNRGSASLKLRFLKVLMSATGTRPKTVELYGAGAQTWRRAAALLTRARAINQALGGAWFYVVWGRWCARWLAAPSGRGGLIKSPRTPQL